MATWAFTGEGLGETPIHTEKHENWYIVGPNDTERDKFAGLTYIDDTGVEKGTLSMGAVPRGCATWQELIDKDRAGESDGFYVAHRGGSRSWIEHTKNAYSQAVAFGIDALEFSCNRSKDGVWFGLHDKDFSRLGGTDKDPFTMTWDEIVASLPAEKVPARLDWLLDRYGQDYVIVVDPKYRAGIWRELAEYIRERNVTPAQIVFKYYGDSNWLFEQVKAEGFGAWGYAYPNNTTESWYETFKSSTGPLDFLSMQWDAEKKIVDDLRASNKPVVAHVLDDHFQAVAAQQKGMISAIVAGINGTFEREV